jgi:tetratricopeptide (TPR) repeat protein
LLPDEGSSFTQIANPLVNETTGVRLLTSFAIFGRYLQLFVWPARLSPDYSFDSLSVVANPLDPTAWFPFLLLALLGFAAYACRRRYPAIAVAIVAFLAPYAIVSNAAFPIGTMLAERLFYLPSIGLCWLLGAVLATAIRRTVGSRPISPGQWVAVLALPALALGIVSFERARVWTDEEALFRDAARTYPRNAAVWITLGELAIRSGRYPAAIERMARVNEIAPDFAKAWLDRGTLLAAAGEFESARQALSHALSLEPNNLLALQNLAVVERARGEPDAAQALDARAAAVAAQRSQRAAGTAPPTDR